MSPQSKDDIVKSIIPPRYTSTEFLIFLIGAAIASAALFLDKMGAEIWGGFFVLLAANCGLVRTRAKKVAAGALDALSRVKPIEPVEPIEGG